MKITVKRAQKSNLFEILPSQSNLPAAEITPDFMSGGENSPILKFMRVMKLTTMILFMSVMLASAGLYSQNTRLTLKFTDISYGDLFLKIEEQSEFSFAFSTSKINPNQKIEIDVTKGTLTEILDQVLPAGVTYEIINRYVVIRDAGENWSTGSQQKGLTGRVTDQSGSALSGVTVVIKGTTTGTITGSDGTYTLGNVLPHATVLFSFVGMKSQEVSVDGKDNIDVVLEEESFGIEEVVAIGYGTVKKSNLTSSVSKITTEAIENRPIMLLGEAFQGQLAGVRSQASGGGVPGEELTIRIRGMNTINGDSSPLYVIDGVPRNSMNDINPNDIASIQILKDASATSIYGSRGGNGVVLIETKNGKGKPTVTFDAYYGLSNSEKKLDIMNGPEWVAWNMYRRNVAHLRAGGSMSDPMSSRLAATRIPESWATTADFTDWQDAVLQTAPIQNYQLSASAAGDIGNIYFSAGYMNQDGIVKYSYYNRKNIRLNATIHADKKFKVGVNLSAITSDRDGADADGGSNGNGKESALHHALMLTPLMRLDQGTRDWGFPENVGTTYPNPVEQLKYTTDNTKYTRVATSLWAEYTILNGLMFKSQYGYNYDGYTYEFYQPGNVTYNNGNVTRGNSTATTTGDWTIQNTLSCDRSIGEHHINLLLGQSAEKQKYYRIYAEASGWPYESIETLNVATKPTSATTNRTTYSNASFFGRLNYDYKEKYLFSASIRYDGSSRFGSNSKWGYFPSISAGWKINEEAFLKNADWISLLKIRAALGMSGNDRIGDYAYMALLGTYNTSWGNEVVSGVAPSRIANEDLQWESTQSIDLGLDFSAFNSRIQFNFDYYRNKTSDLLFSVPIPYATGFSSYTTNIGSIENRGWEVDITSYNIKGNFNWSTNLNLSKNKNKVLDMGDIEQFTSTSWDAQFITRVGGPVSQFYVYKTDGILTASDFDAAGNALVPILSGQEEGNVKYVNQTDDELINSNDLVPHGNNLPDVIYGLTNRFSWKNIDLSILIQGQHGGDILFMGQRQYDAGGANANGFRRWLRSYKPDYEERYGEGENPLPVDYIEANGIDFSWDGKTPNPIGTNNNNDDRRIYDASYLRIKNITLGYTLPKDLLKNNLLSSIRCYVSLDNLKTFSDYPGYTPETNSFGNSTTMMGVDYSTYPLSRRCVFGVSIVF